MTKCMRATFNTVIIVLILFGMRQIALADDAGPTATSSQVPLFLDIELVKPQLGAITQSGETLITLPGSPVRISGAASLELAGKQIQVTISPPQQGWDVDPSEPTRCPGDAEPVGTRVVATFIKVDPTIIAAKVGQTGTFDVEFTPKNAGEYTVVAQDPDKKYRGEKKFIAGNPELEIDCTEIPLDDIKKESTGLVTTVCEAAPILLSRVKELPPSPLKAEMEQRAQDLAQQVKNNLDCDNAPAWTEGLTRIIDLRKNSPYLRSPTRIIGRQIEDWSRGARTANKNAPKAIASMTQGNVVCDQLDIVVNGFKFIDFYLGLIIAPSKFLADWAKENIPTKLVGMVPLVSQNAALKDAIEVNWKGVTSYTPKRDGKEFKIGAKGFDRTLATGKVATAVASWFAARAFEQFCQTFQGSIDGDMAAEFYVKGKLWWRYNIAISGTIILRYPKDAKGDVIALTGEIIGNATSLKSSDNAVPVLYPGLAQGTLFRTYRVEPIAMDTFPSIYKKNLGVSKSVAAPDFNPAKSIIDQGGMITQLVMTPAFFRVPVRAELLGKQKKIRLEVQKAAVDIDDLRVKVVHIILPVLSLWPDVVDYSLPYKGAQFMMSRAMDDATAEFDVETVGDAMKFTKTFKRQKSNSEAKGLYNLKISACNPGC